MRFLTTSSSRLRRYVNDVCAFLGSVPERFPEVRIQPDGISVLRLTMERLASDGVRELPDGFEVIVDDPGSANWRIKRRDRGSLALRLADYSMRYATPQRSAATAAINGELDAIAAKCRLPRNGLARDRQTVLGERWPARARRVSVVTPH